MDSDHRMRCSMSPSSDRIRSLATDSVVRYPLAHGSETYGIQLSSKFDHRDGRDVGRALGLCQDYGAGAAEASDRRRSIHGACAGSQKGVPRRIFQWMGEGGNADEDCGFLRPVVGGCTVASRGTHLHVSDRWDSVGDTASCRRFHDRRIWEYKRHRGGQVGTC
jgi:hypothetical protein